ncbi:histidine kinase [Nostoc linckia]|uniref:histidine kinase n=1 Tax=Nostoc linckia TaxID=92942 RepID=UPI000C29C69B|nr:histidine kinase [Nostoc linckia]
MGRYGEKGDGGDGETREQGRSVFPNAPMPHAPCPMPNTQYYQPVCDRSCTTR